MGVRWIAAVLSCTSDAKEAFEQRSQEREVAANDCDAHFHEGPSAGIDLRVSCVVWREGLES